MKIFRLLPLFLLLLLALAGCGKKGPLVAPEALRYPPVADLSARQQGDVALISWSSPYGARDDIGAFRIYRREVLPPDQDCEECTGAYALVRTLDLEMPNGVVRDGKRFIMTDAEVLPGKTYQYRLHAMLIDGSVAAVSNPSRLAVGALPLPPGLTAEASPVSVMLSWEPIPTAAGGTPPRYQLYRRQGDAPWTLTPLTAKPLEATRYEDFPPLQGATWHYVVRALVTIDGAVAETAASDVATMTIPPPEK
jgi:predicted small lipoprotein YifL